MMAWLVSGVVSSLLLGGLVSMIATLLAQRWALVAASLDVVPVSWRDRDQLVLPLRFAA